MLGLFNQCNKLEYLDLSNFDTSNVTNTGFMFNECYKLKVIKGINNFDTSNVVYMIGMFQGCRELEYLDLSNFKTFKVDNMEYLFNNCNKLKEIKGINNFNTSKVKNMIAMFNECNQLEYLDLSNFNTSNVDDMGKMFRQCTKLKKIIGINKFNMSKVIKKDEMFLGCDLEHLILSNFGNDAVKSNNGVNSPKGNPFAIIFTSTDQSIHYASVCYKSEKFSEIEEKLFKEYPELKLKEIIYLSNGSAIDRNATLEENKLKDNSNIIIVVEDNTDD